MWAGDFLARHGFDVHAGLIVERLRHLRRDEAIPDELVELVLLVGQVFSHLLGRKLERRRADCFVRFLRILARLEDVRLRGQEALAVPRADELARLGDGVGAHAHRVGTHVRDETDETAVLLEVDAFVQPLRDVHRALGTEAQIARRVLLELARRVRGGRVALLFALRDADHLVLRGFEVGADRRRLFAVRDFDLFAVGLDEASGERLLRRAAQPDADVPVLFRYERLDLALPLDDEAERNGLDAAGAQTERKLVPDEGRHVVTDDAIEHPAGALGIVKVLVELARLLDAVLDALLRDLVELDAMHLELFSPELLGEVPRNRLTFAVGVGREQEDVAFLASVLSSVRTAALLSMTS